MIVDSCEDFRLSLEQILSDAFRIYHCSNGKQALEAIPLVNPDVIVLDLMLTEVDGITLLQEIQNAGLRPKVLAVTRFYTDYVLECAHELGIGYIMRKPCSPEAVSQRVRDLNRRMNGKPSKPDNPAQYVTERIKFLQISPRHKGFEYLKEAVMMMYSRPDISITKELYPNVGALFGSTAFQVERSIRSAINAAWERQDVPSWSELFHPGPDGSIPRPSNGTVICRLADDLRERMRD